MTAKDAVTALRRFGLGPRPGEPRRIASDPRGFVLSQLYPPQVPAIADLPTSAWLWQEADRFREAKNRRRKALEDADMPGDMGGAMEGAAGGAVNAGMGRPLDEAMNGKTPLKPGAMLRNEIAARLKHQMSTDRPLVDRLVTFWSNHFTISVQGLYLRSIAGAYEREAIRPHVLGRFRDLLHAVVRHPAMLVYLDNNGSIGPNSRNGRRRGRGLNENLAREVLELHTVGVKGGYGQDDVVHLARALTGWSVSTGADDEQGTFRFKPNAHEPGAVTIMGSTYPEGGIEQAEAVLDDLAAHPATARHVAHKLAVHFVGETAPASLVERLAAEFRRSDGDLAAVTRVLVSSDEAWSAEPRKVLPPYDFLIAVFRALENLPRFPVVAEALRTFGHVMWLAPSPAGWPDEDEAWASPHAVLERLDWVRRIAAGSPRSSGGDIMTYAEDLFAGTLSDFTRQAIARAESREQALTLLFMSPEFQRR